jgi:hypothetical protein
MGCYFDYRDWVVFLVVSFCLAGCATSGVIAPVGEGFLVSEAGCPSCDTGDRAMSKAKAYCAERGKPYWSVRDLDGLITSELSTHVFYCEDPTQTQEPLYRCGQVIQDLAQGSFADDDLLGVLRQIFPSSQVTALKRSRTLEKADAETRRAIETLNPIYKSCVTYFAERQVLTERVYLQMHLNARLGLLEQLRHGEVSLLAYASAMSVLNSQLHAGVFFQ